MASQPELDSERQPVATCSVVSYECASNDTPCTDQENAESASTKLKVLGTVGVPYKRLEALSELTVNPKCVEAHRIAAEYSFSSLTCPVDTGYRRSG